MIGPTQIGRNSISPPTKQLNCRTKSPVFKQIPSHCSIMIVSCITGIKIGSGIYILCSRIFQGQHSLSTRTIRKPLAKNTPHNQITFIAAFDSDHITGAFNRSRVALVSRSSNSHRVRCCAPQKCRCCRCIHANIGIIQRHDLEPGCHNTIRSPRNVTVPFPLELDGSRCRWAVQYRHNLNKGPIF